MEEKEVKDTKKEEKVEVKENKTSVKKEKNTDKMKQKDIEKFKEELKEEIKKEMINEMKETKKEETEENKKSFEDSVKENVNKILDTEDTTKDYDKKDIESNKGMAILSYLGPLVLIPYFVEKNSKFVNYHKKQGLNLFLIEVIFGFISYILTSTVQITKMCTVLNDVKIECGTMVPWWIIFPLRLMELVIGIISIVGLVYACQGKAKELPLIGKIKIVK